MERRLKGFKDFLPKEAYLREMACVKIMQVAHSFGFQNIATPTLEYAETLFGFGGTDKEVYAFKDHGGRDVGLRFDLTVPFARYVSENFNELSFPFKKIQIGEVFRGEKPQRGRYRQFCQADFDIIGSEDVAADLEIIQVMQHALLTLLPSSQPFCFRVNSRKLLDRIMLENFGFNDDPVYTMVDKLEKVGDAKFLEVLEAQYQKDPTPLLKALKSDVRSYPESKDLYHIADLISHVKVDATIARGLGYYTGMVFETTLLSDPSVGSIASGGRYGNLVSRFCKHELSGVGGSIGVDRLIAAVELDGSKSLRVFIAMSTLEHYATASDIAQKIRSALPHAVVDVHVKSSKLAQQFKLADKLESDFVLILGDEEIQSGHYTVKHLKTGQQDQHRDFDSLISRLREQKLTWRP